MIDVLLVITLVTVVIFFVGKKRAVSGFAAIGLIIGVILGTFFFLPFGDNNFFTIIKWGFIVGTFSGVIFELSGFIGNRFRKTDVRETYKEGSSSKLFDQTMRQHRKNTLLCTFFIIAIIGLIWGLINHLGPDNWLQLFANIMGLIMSICMFINGSKSYQLAGGKTLVGWAVNLGSLVFGVVIVRSIIGAFF